MTYEKIQQFKNKAIAWNNNIISNNEFSEEIKVLMEDGIIQISLVDLDNLDAYDLNLPSWMKRTTSFWISNSISDQEFINAIEYVLEIELVSISNNYVYNNQQ